MEDNHTDTDGNDYSQMYVYAGPEKVDMSDMTVYAAGAGKVDGHPVVADIIGTSHHITMGLPNTQYNELTSCAPPAMKRDVDPVVVRSRIPDGIDDIHIRDIGGYRVELHVKTVPFEPFDPESDRWDVAHTFEGDGPAAPTAIRFENMGWTTIHTYPEFDKSVFTHTDFFPVR